MSQRKSSKRTQLTSHLQFHFILLREDSQKISLITPIITKFLNRIPIATSARLPSTHFEKKTSNEIVPHLFYNPINKGKRVIAGRREETKNHYLFSKTLIFSIILLYPVFLGYIIIFLNRRHARRVGMKQKIKYLLYNVDIKTDSFFLYF